MNDRWADALTAARDLQHRERDRWVLWTIARLPFLNEEVLENLAGVRSRSLYGTVGQLMKSRLVAAIVPPLKTAHSPRLLYQTDLGVAALAVLHGVEPEALAGCMRITRRHLIRLILGLPMQGDAYRILSALALAGPGPSTLLQWEYPWRRHHVRPTNKGPVWTRLPALAALAWDDRQLRCLLVPDRGHMPMRAYRPALGHLLSTRAIEGNDLPPLVVATNEGRRKEAWQAALREVAALRGERPLAAHVAAWTDLPSSLQGIDAFSRCSDAHSTARDRAPCELRALRSKTSGRSLPQIVGSLLESPKAQPGTDERRAQVALAVAPSDREAPGPRGAASIPFVRSARCTIPPAHPPNSPPAQTSDCARVSAGSRA